MPFYLNDRDITSDLAGVQSALIVPCRFCPAASRAVRENAPYVQLLRGFLRTPAYERHVRALTTRLARAGIRTRVFGGWIPVPSVLCMANAAKREELARLASEHEAMVVLGCDAALETARSCAGASGCRVVPGMEVEGIMNVVPSLRFPLDVWLDMRSLTRVLQPPAGALRPSSPNEPV